MKCRMRDTASSIGSYSQKRNNQTNQLNEKDMLDLPESLQALLERLPSLPQPNTHPPDLKATFDVACGLLERDNADPVCAKCTKLRNHRHLDFCSQGRRQGRILDGWCGRPTKAARVTERRKHLGG
ncbi:unnamed protein product [Symbiodinium natans]|uniref:Uncharacterized protein n=1 Tax=Symbiodinium natans TaxID=878477 RepID=A0A812I5J5_9DINO|nr:unnamed protein product [Symbiodinium natans]